MGTKPLLCLGFISSGHSLNISFDKIIYVKAKHFNFLCFDPTFFAKEHRNTFKTRERVPFHLSLSCDVYPPKARDNKARDL
jgi:hypothetical protein